MNGRNERNERNKTGDGFLSLLSLCLWFFFGASAASFFTAAASRLLSLPSDGTGDSTILSLLSSPSRCVSCGRKLRAFEMVPVLSCILLRGRCSRCGAKFGLSNACVETAGGAFALFVVLKYAGFVSPDATGAEFVAGTASIILSFGFLILCAATDASEGVVFDFAGGWCVLFFTAGMCLLGRNDILLPLFFMGWTTHVFSLASGTIGGGDAAPFSTAFSSVVALGNSKTVFPPDFAGWFFAFPSTVFFYTFFTSVLLHLLIRARRSSKTEKRVPPLFGKMEKIPLVPHFTLALFASLVFFPVFS